MNKIFLSGVALTLFSGVAFAQDMDSLFPELENQFEQPTVSPKTAPKTENQDLDSKNSKLDLSVNFEKEDGDDEDGEESAKPDLPTQKSEVEKNQEKPADKTEASADKKKEKDEKVEGKLVVEIQNVDGVLPYARTLSYCSAEAVLNNESNRMLQQLSLTITYKDMPKDLNYSYVSAKKSRTQKFMLIGLPCESIKGMPKLDIKACKLGTLSEEDCKKRVQLIPPQG